ncbi:MAG: ABC transporter permease, partial [Oceanospirillum sp.]|nr:ABC transporter permease [Oceanospirillum sp.]
MLDKIPFFIGLRYTRAKRRNHFISFISLTSMLGLTLGVAVLILVLSVMNGFDRELRQRILGMVPHATISSQSGFQNWPEVAEKLEQDEHIQAAVPYVKAQGMFTHRGYVRGALVNGVMPELEGKVSIMKDHMVAGSLDELKPGEFGIIMGDLLARFIGVGVGDKVTLMIPEASMTPAGVFPRMKRFTVVGLFSVGAELD